MTDKEKAPGDGLGQGTELKRALLASDSIAETKTVYNIPQAEGRLIPPGRSFTLNHKPYNPNPGWLFLVTRCPYCGRQHVHGGAPSLAELKPYRLAHCGRGEYQLKGGAA